MSAKEYLDQRLEAGKKPIFYRIKLSDAPDFIGKLTEAASFYNSMLLFPEVIIGNYRGVTIILNVKAL